MTLTMPEPGPAPGTDVAVVDPPQLTLEQWVRNLATTAEGVERIIDTPFIPASFWPLPPGKRLQDMPNQDPARIARDETAEDHAARRRVAIATTTTAINVGAELGLGPSAALKYLYVTRGRPQLYAEGMLALVHMRGHATRKVERSTTRAAVAIRLRGSSEWTEYEFTYEDAERAKYPEQNAKYRTDPAAMLWARCVSIAVRSECPEVLGGLPGEADGFDVIPGEVVEAPARVTIDDVKAAPASEGPQDGAPPAPEPLSERTWRAIGEVFLALGVPARPAARRFDILERILGHHVGGRADVTEDEGRQVVDTLRGLDDAGRRDLLGLRDDPAAPAAPPVDEGDPYGGADPDADGDVVDDPTTDPGFPAVEPMDGPR